MGTPIFWLLIETSWKSAELREEMTEAAYDRLLRVAMIVFSKQIRWFGIRLERWVSFASAKGLWMDMHIHERGQMIFYLKDH